MIYFARHGQTNLNKQKILQGHIDEPLNEVGVLQAIELAKTLESVKFDYIFCSPLKRAMATAEAVAKYQETNITPDSRIVELYIGEMQGKPYTEENLIEYLKNPKAYGGESLSELFERVKEFMVLLEKIKDKNILIVSHGGVFRALNYYLKGKDVEKDELEIPHLKNCEFIKIEI